ncbi:Uncharacterized protein BP5553_04735 [Venustampulla echinocandica]|uniref:Protein kinase domain-containing protein n=1 Tax=Venustampulla echinocandica TaxID=2656787 RepID=A0A370TP55_9HELO|nr:Uncharacterized protein BP5553_04735 [Venustampulla echinocandica]RDL37302.1 Uncharacterized protein BP5553_04735 [Venustampulla echinocandica]
MDSTSPSFQVMDSQFDSESSWITVMCQASRFQITVSLKDLRGICFELEYSELVAKVDQMDGGADDDYDALCSWIVEPCFSYFRECTSHIPKDLTFEAFYYPPTYHLKIIVSGSSLYAKATRDRHTINPFALMIPSRDLPQYPKVCRSRASDIQIVPAITGTYDYMSETPHVKMAIGLLFDFIPSIGESLQSRQCKMASEHHAKWRRQVTAIVKELHSHDIVWGNVHPGNIVIDMNFDAWVVDFGDGWIEDFVDRKKAGIKEGDWQVVQRIFENWITR